METSGKEIFDPVIPIITVDSEEKAARLANESTFGLGAVGSDVGRDFRSGAVVSAAAQSGSEIAGKMIAAV